MLGPSDEDILHLAELPEGVRRDWLLTYQPTNPGERFYWWDTLMEVSLDRLRDSSPLSAARRQYAVLAAQVTREAMELQVVPSWEGCMRLAYLVAEYSRYPDSDMPDLLSPDQVVREVLEMFGKSYEETVKAVEDWPSRPIEEMAELRRMKNVIRGLEKLFPHIVDPEVRRSVSRWLRLCENLP